MFSKVDYVMVMVSDMGRSVAFYRDTLGLRLKFESPGWSEFETGGTTLALHPGTPAATSAAASQTRPVAGTCSLGFSVSDSRQRLCRIAQARSKLRHAAH